MDLGGLLQNLPLRADPNLLVGFESSDDAGVFRLGDDLALVQTVDIITPVCDDPFLFGQIAAANSLSDVYAMGGKPLTALNICCFPPTGAPVEVLRGILEGGLSKIQEAGAVLAGGHTVRDQELKYGLSVTGSIHPGRILRNSAAAPGDAVVLTKPIGTGLLIGGARKGVAPEDGFRAALEGMARLNDLACYGALRHGARAATDITGFGFAGHALEIARGSGVGLRIRFDEVPVYPGALEMVGKGVRTAVTESNRSMAGDSIRIPERLGDAERTLLFDPQTSGGLLVCLPSERAASLVEELAEAEQADARVIGEVFLSDRPTLEIV